MAEAAREPGTIENGVLFGADGQLFLADGGHAVLEFALGRRRVEARSIQAFEENIAARGEWLDHRNIPYAHVIFPDKQSVLVDQFPYGEPVCLGNVYLEAARSVAGRIVYPLAALRTLGVAAFQRTDTHMTDLGTLSVAHTLLDRLQGASHASAFAQVRDAITVPQEWIGDLGRRFTPHLQETRLVLKRHGNIRWVHNDLKGANNGMVDIFCNPNAMYDKRLLIFGDSFGRDLARMLSIFVSQVVFLRTPFFHPDICEQFVPHFVVTENVERYLSMCTSDEARPLFWLYPFMGTGQYTPSREFAETLSAIFSYPREPYRALRVSFGMPADSVD